MISAPEEVQPISIVALLFDVAKSSLIPCGTPNNWCESNEQLVGFL
jgi:hypothetical protein